ncbi:MAG: glycerol-3-phosphate 1-O-acyltransferase PlsY [Clostridia bacterium]|nr:glycerol-3-phosphate 1-O-acyltransferase PlsY [Clostridia bacterium]
MNFTELWNLGILFSGVEQVRTTGDQVLIVVGWVIAIVAAYLLGSINLSIIISSKFYNDDIRLHGSGNAGMTNVMRTYGKKMAIITFAGDFFKAVIASLVGRVLLGYPGAYIAGLFCFLGHIFPCFYKFKGGKGVVTAAAMILMTNPLVCGILFALFVMLVLATKFISLGSVVCLLAYPIILHRISGPGLPVLVAILMGVFCAYAHRGNIKRIMNGTERKFTFKVKDKKTVKQNQSANDIEEA